MTRSTPFLLLAAALFPFLLSACYQVPVTGRSALSTVDDKAVIAQSVAQFGEMKKKMRASTNREQIERVQRVGGRLAKVAFWDIPNADWEFVVFDAPQINAFAMPGGKVGVFSGLFKIIKNDDQLASVLAHEIAHVAAHHSHERLSQAMGAQVGQILVGGALMSTGAPSIPSQVIMDAYGISATGVTLAYDRKKEKEADQIGIIYMARAGYNPEESVTVIEQLESETAGKGTPQGWFSTHPTYPDRILNLIDSMPKAREVYGKSDRAVAPIVIK